MRIQWTAQKLDRSFRIICTHGWDAVSMFHPMGREDFPINTMTTVDCNLTRTLKSVDGTRMLGVYDGICEDCGEKFRIEALVELERQE